MKRRPLDVADDGLHVESLHVGVVGTVEIEEIELRVESADGDVVGRIGLDGDLANVGGAGVLHIAWKQGQSE